MKNKKSIVILIIIIISIISLFIFFAKNNYKTSNLGNNKVSKTTEGITEYILNMSSYNAKIELTVESNKNINKYVIQQQYVSPNISKQQVLEPSNIQNLITIFDGKTLKIENTKLNLSTIYQDYKYITENNLFLNFFVEDYKNSNESKSEEKDGIIIMQTKCRNEGNKYAVYKKLYIDKNTLKPVKMEIQDVNQSTVVYILYNEIEINSTKKEEVLAFKEDNILSNI